MHALGRYLEKERVSREWNQAEFARRAGVSPQVMSNLLDKSRTYLTRPISDKTIAGLAKALGGVRTEDALRRLVSESLRLADAKLVRVPDPTLLTDDELLREVARRLAASGAASSLRVVPADEYEEAAYDPDAEPGSSSDNLP